MARIQRRQENPASSWRARASREEAQVGPKDRAWYDVVGHQLP